MLHANLTALRFIELEWWAIEVYIAGIGISDVFGSCVLDVDDSIRNWPILPGVIPSSLSQVIV